MTYTNAEKQIVILAVENNIEGIADEMLKTIKEHIENNLSEIVKGEVIYNCAEKISFKTVQLATLKYMKNEFLGKVFLEFNDYKYHGILCNKENSRISDPDWQRENMGYLD